MVSVASVSQSAIALEYVCQRNLDLYDSPECERLATQAAAGRHLKLARSPQATAVEVRLCEDDYPCWLSLSDLETLAEATAPYQAVARSRSEIEAKLPEAIAFAQAAMQQPNYYLWGGTVGLNYDCSGLMQAAFASVGIWLPRDSYQQEAFTEPVSLDELKPGDLIFFGTPEKATHVALYLGESRYLHSSGKTQVRNGIAIDPLSDRGDAVVQTYFKQLRGAGRVVCSYCPT
uniref:NlpC/P60 family protein n=1 Tax=Desertifilum tharense IPPAS B-1220 TaxID=1781255 RepID=A0ACD5GU02_9CYAN